MKIKMIGLISLIFTQHSFSASPIEDIFNYYKLQGVIKINPKAGKTLWNNQFKVPDSELYRSCTSCHGSDISSTGKHIKTGKEIQPMAKRINNNRYTDIKKVGKWFKRNCKWTLGRECSLQEQADILNYLSNY